MLSVKGKQHKTRAIAKDSFVKIYQSPQGEWILETKTDGIETIIVTHINGKRLKNKTQDDVNRLVAENLDEHGAHAGGYSQEYDTYIRNLIQTELAQKPTGYNR